jgi:hypothetical protein
MKAYLATLTPLLCSLAFVFSAIADDTSTEIQLEQERIRETLAAKAQEQDEKNQALQLNGAPVIAPRFFMLSVSPMAAIDWNGFKGYQATTISNSALGNLLRNGMYYKLEKGFLTNSGQISSRYSTQELGEYLNVDPYMISRQQNPAIHHIILLPFEAELSVGMKNGASVEAAPVEYLYHGQDVSFGATPLKVKFNYDGVEAIDFLTGVAGVNFIEEYGSLSGITVLFLPRVGLAAKGQDKGFYVGGDFNIALGYQDCQHIFSVGSLFHENGARTDEASYEFWWGFSSGGTLSIGVTNEIANTSRKKSSDNSLTMTSKIGLRINF